MGFFRKLWRRLTGRKACGSPIRWAEPVPYREVLTGIWAGGTFRITVEGDAVNAHSYCDVVPVLMGEIRTAITKTFDTQTELEEITS